MQLKELFYIVSDNPNETMDQEWDRDGYLPYDVEENDHVRFNPTHPYTLKDIHDLMKSADPETDYDLIGLYHSIYEILWKKNRKYIYLLYATEDEYWRWYDSGHTRLPY